MTIYLQKVFPTSIIRTNNQWLSLTDQLGLGSRFLELDTHWVLGGLRLAHCGGVQIPVINDFILLLDRVAAKFGFPPIPWDSGDIGCWPSGSSIPAKVPRLPFFFFPGARFLSNFHQRQDQRLLRDGYAEIAAWLADNPNEFIILYRKSFCLFVVCFLLLLLRFDVFMHTLSL